MDEVVLEQKLCAHRRANGKACRHPVEPGETLCRIHSQFSLRRFIRRLPKNYPILFWLAVAGGVGIVFAIAFFRTQIVSFVAPRSAFQQPPSPVTSTNPNVLLSKPRQTYGNLRERTLALAFDIRAFGKLRLSLRPVFGPDRNVNARAETAWMQGNYAAFHHSFYDQLHDVQREYAGFYFGISDFDSRIKTMDDQVHSPQQIQIMFENEFCEWVNDLVILADEIPHPQEEPGLGKCDKP